MDLARQFCGDGAPLGNDIPQLGFWLEAAHDHYDVYATWPQIACGAERFSHQTFGSIAYYRATNFPRGGDPNSTVI